MLAAALNRLPLPSLRVSKMDVLRGLLAGAAWAVIVAAGLTAWSAWQCGGVCLEDVAISSGLSLVAGILGIGPVAALGGKPRAS
jgi:hypothetical protein